MHVVTTSKPARPTTLRDVKVGQFFQFISEGPHRGMETYGVCLATWFDEDEFAYNFVRLSDPTYTWSGAKDSTLLDAPVVVFECGTEITVKVGR